ncbi:hypothetical protein AB0M11_32835 [Streptomyces sp. NPDC051987]|uniref:hypothetical protein n=1 Tax=Streptomyces sp. NPDC051987 TaxID=3155808 RepID=UPI0034292C5B
MITETRERVEEATTSSASGELTYAKLLLGASGLDRDFLEIVGDAVEGARGFVRPADVDPSFFEDHPDQTELDELFQSNIRIPVAQLAVTPTTYCYDAVETLYVAVEAARSVQPDALQVVLEAQDVWGVQGPIMRSNTAHSGCRPESAIHAVVADGALVPRAEELCAS